MAQSEVARRNRKEQRKSCMTMDELHTIVLKGKNNKPNYGAILHYYRLQAGRSAVELAASYSKALQKRDDTSESDPITPNWIYMMENQNMVPTDKKRRLILAQLLQIPFSLFGLNALQEVTSSDMAIFSTLLQPGHVNLVEYTAKLQYYHKEFSADTLHLAIPDIQQRINNLSNDIHGKIASEKTKMLVLLCEYYILLATIAHEYSQFQEAINLLDHAVLVAQSNNLYDTLAFALRQRGITHLDRGEITSGLTYNETAQKDFEKAVENFDAIKEFEAHLSPQRRALIWLPSGRVYGHVAKDQQALKQALKLVDLGSKVIGIEGDDTAILDEERYHMDKGVTFIVSPYINYPKEAQREFDLATEHTHPQRKLRHIENAARQAEASLLARQYPMAVTFAEQTLSLMGRGSSQHLPRVQNIYDRLVESSYGQMSEVAELGVEVMKKRNPDVFVAM